MIDFNEVANFYFPIEGGFADTSALALSLLPDIKNN